MSASRDASQTDSRVIDDVVIGHAMEEESCVHDGGLEIIDESHLAVAVDCLAQAEMRTVSAVRETKNKSARHILYLLYNMKWYKVSRLVQRWRGDVATYRLSLYAEMRRERRAAEVNHLKFSLLVAIDH